MASKKSIGFIFVLLLSGLLYPIKTTASHVQELIITKEEQVGTIKGEITAPNISKVEPGRKYLAYQVRLKNDLKIAVDVTLYCHYLNDDKLRSGMNAYVNDEKISLEKGNVVTLQAGESKLIDLSLAFEGEILKNDSQEKILPIEWIFNVSGSKDQTEQPLPKTGEKELNLGRFLLCLSSLFIFFILIRKRKTSAD